MEICVNPGPCNNGEFTDLPNLHKTERITYSCNQLFTYRKPTPILHHDKLGILKLNGILRYRGKRAGHRSTSKQYYSPLQFQIPVQSTNRRSKMVNPRHIKSVLINTRTMHLQPCLPSIMLFNARSLSNKFNDLEVTLVSNYNNLHVIAVTGFVTWDLRPGFVLRILPWHCQLSSFVQFHRDGSDRIGGGVALYVGDDTNARTVFGDLIPLHLEVLWVNLQSIDEQFTYAFSIHHLSHSLKKSP